MPRHWLVRFAVTRKGSQKSYNSFSTMDFYERTRKKVKSSDEASLTIWSLYPNTSALMDSKKKHFYGNE